MNILITGGTGLIGRALIRELKGHQLSVLTRDEIRAGNLLGNGINFMSSLGTIANLNDYDAVINPLANLLSTNAGQTNKNQ